MKEALAQAIVHKSLDLQLKRESEIQNRLEEIAKLELVKKIRSERQQRSTLLTPSSSSASGHHPAWKYFTLYRNKHENFPPSRPRTAYQRQPPRDSASVTSVETSSYNDSCSESTATTLRGSYLQTKNTKSAGVHQRKHPKTGQKKPGSSFTRYEQEKIRYEQEKLKMSPYLYPVPGMEKPTSKLFDVQSAVRKMHHPPESMSNKRTNCLVTLKYLGTGSNITWEEPSLGVEIVIQQQHCGGNTMCVYRNHHNTDDKFSFVSYRHLNFPYSLSIYLAGILYTRVSACCEYRHRKGTRIGGPQGLFSLVNVKGASPCARCQVNRQMMEAKKQKRPKTDTKLPEEDRTDVESVAASLVETQISKENRKAAEREEDVKNEGNQEPCSENDDEEDQHGPISFAVSGTVIDVEESSSGEEDDYQDDFEDETDVTVAAKKEKQDGPGRKESSVKDSSEDDEEVVKDEDGSSEDSSSSGTEDSASSEDEKEEGEIGDIKSEKEEAIHELKNRSGTNDEASSVKSEERTLSEEGNSYEDDFHKDGEINNKNDKISASKMEENEHNSSLQSSSLDKNGKGEKDKDSVKSDDSSENTENETNEIKDSVDLPKQQEKDSSIKSKSAQVKTEESAGKTESDITGRSDSTSSKESSSSLPPASRKKSKMKSERRHRSNNRKKTPGSSSDSDSIAHLPAELEGTEKAKNWVPARQQETL